MDMPLLGPFKLEHVLGSGAHGVVWRAHHVARGLPVAVKVLSRETPRARVDAEVHAAARLHHAHIIAVLASGEVAADTRATPVAAGPVSSDPAPGEAGAPAYRTLSTGDLWIATELASGGDLGRLAPPVPWPVAFDVLTALLLGLAHAHARGVIHRDLKPGNVLLCLADDVRPGIKLSDFGLAVKDRESTSDGGTPLFMAPEQFHQGVDPDTTAIGPWTDLYALGCLSHWLVRGTPPFAGQGWRALSHQHVSTPPPPLPVGADAPPGFEPFVARLLEKRASDRFVCAADALDALRRTDPHRVISAEHLLPTSVARALLRAAGERLHASSAPTDSQEPDQSAPTSPLPGIDGRALARGTKLPRPVLDAATAPTLVPVRGGAPEARPAVARPLRPASNAVAPATWRIAERAPLPDLRLVEAGLALDGVRPTPMVGREQERDRLWELLLQVHAGGGARACVVEGDAGVGKSKLVDWLCHRAAETGAGQVFRARHAPDAPQQLGLQRMVAEHCGFSFEDVNLALHVRRFLETWLPSGDVSEAELLGLVGRRELGAGSPGAARTALLRLLRARARERPLLIAVDDAQWASEALACVRAILEDVPELPALIVVAASTDAMAHADGAAEPAELAELKARPATVVLALQPLTRAEHHALCSVLLGGNRSPLLDVLWRRTEGNAGFAVQLVRDWVARGRVAVTADGLAPKPGVALIAPDALHTLWDERLDRLFRDAPEAQAAVELAAVAGTEVERGEWQALCNDEGVVVDLDAVTRTLSTLQLARPTPQGFVFRHVVIRATIERRAHDAGRLRARHATAARALAAFHAREPQRAAGRVGRHLHAAGDVSEGRRVLLGAAAAVCEAGDVREAASLWSQWHATIADSPADTDDAIADGLVTGALIAEQDDRVDEAAALANAALARAAAPEVRAQALCARATAACARGEASAAAADVDTALLLVDPRSVTAGRALRLRADTHYMRGEWPQAHACYGRARTIFEQHGKPRDLALTFWGQGYALMWRQEHAAARAVFEEQRALCTSIGDQLGEANAHNALGELARRTGDTDAALRSYQAALSVAERNGLRRRGTYRVNIALTLCARGDVEHAAEEASEVLTLAHLEPGVRASAWWVLAAAAARRMDADACVHAVRAAHLTDGDVNAVNDLGPVAAQVASFWTSGGMPVPTEVTSAIAEVNAAIARPETPRLTPGTPTRSPVPTRSTPR